MYGVETLKVIYEHRGIESMTRHRPSCKATDCGGSDIPEEWSAILTFGLLQVARDSGTIPLGLAKSVAKATFTESQLPSIWIGFTPAVIAFE